MPEISTFRFDNSDLERIRKHRYGGNWPVVYLIENGKDLYVGETTRAYIRTKEHLDNKVRTPLKNIHLVFDDEFNVSAALDTESSLIEYLAADGKYTLQNGNGGLQNHRFYDRERYRSKFELLWKELQKLQIARNDLLQIKNSDLFKYSPYKTLTDDQYYIAERLLEHVKEKTNHTYLIHGGPGTGKTILATYLIKQLVERGHNKVALVIAMTSLRKTLKKVFRNVPGLSPKMVIGPSDVVKNKYDILFVDEAHRLRQRRNITNYKTFDALNKFFGLSTQGTELDWIVKSAEQVVLFFDEKQSVRPSDIPSRKIFESNPIHFHLKTQVRVKGGDKYLQFVESLLENKEMADADFTNYDFRIYDDLEQMLAAIKKKEEAHELARVVAGYSWDWVSAQNPNIPDIIIGNSKLYWNSTTEDWVNSSNSINEVGCIHTIQGYDLNYAGVIIGPEISYDLAKKTITIDRSKYKDANGHRGVTDSEELKRYIINIYKTLLTRGIMGTYVYIVDKNLRDYFKSKTIL